MEGYCGKGPGRGKVRSIKMEETTAIAMQHPHACIAPAGQLEQTESRLWTSSSVSLLDGKA